MRLINIDTDHGNRIIEELLINGWKKEKIYNKHSFDKGIDFDSYSLIKQDQSLYFEWSNWFEWEVSGSESALMDLSNKYVLEIERKKNQT